MGVPVFFRWLIGKCPQIILNAYDPQIEEFKSGHHPNPEIDNLYLDLNGIIHPCCHPQDPVNIFPLKFFIY